MRSPPGSGGRTGVAPGDLRSGGEVANADGLRVAVDGDGLGAHPHVEVEAAVERRRGLQEQALALFDDAAEVVGESAVRERDVATALEHRDVGVLVEPAQAGGGGHAAGDSADDEVALLGHASIVRIPRGYCQNTVRVFTGTALRGRDQPARIVPIMPRSS
jgi:hypothetical protein